MCIGTLRTMYNGWVDRLYVEPAFFFKFYGFEWVEPLGRTGMYLVFGTIAVSAFMVAVGWMYRLAIIIFFLLFTYVELIDVTNYLNHYYLVCLLAFLMIFLPANRAYSVDAWRNRNLQKTKIPAWCINIIKLQLGLVYFFAGLAKLNPDWLFHAMPLAIWLPTKVDLPVIGWLFNYSWVPYAFSWIGALYDLTIAFFLLNNRTRPFAYLIVIAFHGMTWALFNIGLFPFIMTFSTLIFFSGKFHERILSVLSQWLFALKKMLTNEINSVNSFLAKTSKDNPEEAEQGCPVFNFSPTVKKGIQVFFFTFVLLQIAFPLRHFLYPGDLHWTEEGYRFSWRVMLVEKNGQIIFRVHDPSTGRFSEVDNAQYLTSFQEKQMSIQPDLIVQFARFLEKTYSEKYQINDLKVRAESYVSLNGRPSQVFIDPQVDLAKVSPSLKHQTWVIPFNKTNTQVSQK